ncbi:MAG: hypothetical protein ACREUX_13890 [Burkholderiales bacterium]
MLQLPEPRRFGGGSVTDALALAAIRAAKSNALERPRHTTALRDAVAEALKQGAEARVREALRQAPDAASYRMLTDAAARAIDAARGESGVVARAFALPVVLVASATHELVVPGVLPDVDALRRLFERTQALGPTRNFGLSNALCALQALEALSLRSLLALTRELEPQALGRLLPPAPITVPPGDEQTHLRFVVGAGLTAPESPGFTEIAAHIGPWGVECARLIEQQLAMPGLQLAALPRPPLDLVGAPHAGRSAQLEIALNLFASNAVRRFRQAVGDPVAIVSAHEDAQIRVTLSSPFAEDLVDGFCWPLHPADDLAAVQMLILDLFADMRVPDVRVCARVLASRRDNGAPLHPSADEWDRLGAGTVY